MIDFNNLSAVRYSFANVVYTKKIHEIHKDWENRKFILYNLVTIIMTGFILASIIIGLVYPKQNWSTTVGIALVILEVLWLIVTLSFDPKQRYQAHHNTANRLYILREEYICLMADMINEAHSQKQIAQKRRELLDAGKTIYDEAPSTKNRAYQMAGKKLKASKPNKGEDATLSDDEIDHFLPWMLQYQYLKPYV